MFSALLEVAAFIAFTVAAYVIYPTAALVVGGICLLVVAQAEPHLPRRKSSE